MKRRLAIASILLFMIFLQAAFAQVKTNENALSFPNGFLWGVSNSAQQVEGGLTNNSWAQWEKSGRAPQVGKAADFI